MVRHFHVRHFQRPRLDDARLSQRAAIPGVEL